MTRAGARGSTVGGGRASAWPASVQVVAEATFRPRGAWPFDPRRVLDVPLRPLRGGPAGIALYFGWGAGELHVKVLSGGACTAQEIHFALAAARGLSAVDDDPAGFGEMVARSPELAALARGQDVRLSRTPTIFESLATAVIGQLVTSYEARASTRRLWALAGEPFAGTRLRAPPTAEAVRAVPMWRLREIGIGSRRAATLHALSARGPALERLRAHAPEEVVRRLMSLRGVGPWTANLVARGALGWSDAVPVGDLHVPRLVTEALSGEAGDDDAMLEALEPFRPHRARVVQLVERAAIRRRAVPLPHVDAHRRTPWRY